MVTCSFSQLEEMSEEEKHNIIARFIPCDSCSCNGFHPYNDKDGCYCGHEAFHHIDKGQDLDRRLKVALRLNELLEEKGKLDDYSFEDQDILSLKKQILYNATNDTTVKSSQDIKRDRDTMHSDHHENNTIEFNKRAKIDRDEEDTEMEDEDEEEDEEEEEEDDEDEDEDTDKEDEEDEEEDDEDKEESLENEHIDLSVTDHAITNDEEENHAITTDKVKEENSKTNVESKELLEYTASPKDHTEEDEDKLHLMIKEFLPVEKKESVAMREEKEGEIKVQVVLNNGSPQSMILLTGLKNIFQKQLPKMPKEYIARLVYDRNHCSIALIRPPNKVIGGICYRPFDAQEFAEIVFCAIASTEQVKGYGSFIMNHLKDYVSKNTNMKHFLTYADNYAVGYFRKQGFTTEITLDKRKWVGYIKDYEGGTIMQCTMLPRFKYLQVRDILGIQRNAILKKIEEKSTEHIVYPGIQMPIVDEDGKRKIDPHQVPGISESGWTPEMDALSNRPRHSPYYNQMLFLVEEMQNYTHAWPFLEPVNIDEVTDYYDIIKDPMDLATLEENVKADAYPTMEDFIKDTQKIFDNCKIYNGEDTEYARCSQKLERFFNEKLRSLNTKKIESS